MGKITNKMVECAFEVGIQVYEGKISLSDGKDIIVNKTGMNLSSAQGYINILKPMLSGRCYTRTINHYATQYYLDRIGELFGREAQIKAVEAVGLHIEYYKGKHGELKSIRELISDYQ